MKIGVHFQSKKLLNQALNYVRLLKNRYGQRGLILCLAFISLLFFSEKGISGDASKDLKTVARKVTGDKALAYGQWSISIIDVKTGTSVLGINDHRFLIPASALKVLTTASALTTFGPHHTFKTILAYDGTISEGMLNGNLYILGGGDPTLGSALFKRFTSLNNVLKRWHKALTSQGITKITGEVIADDRWFDFPAISIKWAWDDIGNYYGAGAYGLNIYDNLFFISFNPAHKVGPPASVLRTVPTIEGLVLKNEITTGPKGSGDRAYVFGGPQQFERLLTGTVPAGVRQFTIKGSMPDPPLFTAQRLRKFLIKNDISVEKGAKVIRKDETIKDRDKLTILDTLESPPLKDIIYIVNKRSMNLYAEVLFKHMGREKYGTGSFTNGAKAVKSFLKNHNIGTDGLSLYDGSGLSRANAITTQTLTSVLTSMSKSPYFDSFYDSLPVAGDPEDIGTMKSMLKNTAAAKKVRAKTGSLERVKSHAGYVQSRKGTLYCFAMIANNYTGNSGHIDRLHQRIMLKIFELR